MKEIDINKLLYGDEANPYDTGIAKMLTPEQRAKMQADSWDKDAEYEAMTALIKQLGEALGNTIATGEVSQAHEALEAYNNWKRERGE